MTNRVELFNYNKLNSTDIYLWSVFLQKSLSYWLVKTQTIGKKIYKNLKRTI